MYLIIEEGARPLKNGSLWQPDEVLSRLYLYVLQGFSVHVALSIGSQTDEGTGTDGQSIVIVRDSIRFSRMQSSLTLSLSLSRLRQS